MLVARYSWGWAWCLRLLFLLLQVDPSIIGGMILEVGDKRVDLSIRTKVRKVQQIITETV